MLFRSPEALALMVSLYRQLNRVDDAVLFLERNIAGAITRHPAMYPLLAELHDSQERSAVARKVLEEGLRRYPESEDLLYSYGAFLEQKSEHRAAMDIMQKLVAINPSNAAALNFVGYSWANDGINREIIMVPKVAINGGKPNLAIRIPLNKPNTPPITKIAKNENHIEDRKSVV